MGANRAIRVAPRPIVLVALLLASALAGPPPASAGQWVAGDLHVHTTYSHDSYGGPGDDNTGPDELYALGSSTGDQYARAARRGLDYLAITDHNDIRSQGDPGFGAHGVIAVPGYENSLDGHAQMLGATRIYDSGDGSASAVGAMADALRADAGAFQANHPAGSWSYGYEVPVDTVEVWNTAWYYQPPLPSATDNERSLDYWDGWLDRGRHVAATGGSDNHLLLVTPLAGVGQPTTWVHVEERSAQGVLDGLLAGRTFVSQQPPAYGGARVFLEADADGDGAYESMVGDTVPPGTTMRARVIGAPGARLRVVTDGGSEALDIAVGGWRFEHRFRLDGPASWARVEVYAEDLRDLRRGLCATLPGELADATTYCENRLLMIALSSALYLGP